MVLWDARVWVIALVSVSLMPFRFADATLTGRITDALGCPLAGATVTVIGDAGRILRTASTNRYGGYEIIGLAHGKVTVRAEMVGFVREEIATRLHPGSNVTDLGLALGRIAPTPSHRITGKVMTDRGEVIDAATVTLVNAFTASVVARVRSDANGMFVLETADAGQYIAMATKPDHEVGTESVIFARDDGAGTTLQFRLRKRGACDPG